MLLISLLFYAIHIGPSARGRWRQRELFVLCETDAPWQTCNLREVTQSPESFRKHKYAELCHSFTDSSSKHSWLNIQWRCAACKDWIINTYEISYDPQEKITRLARGSKGRKGHPSGCRERRWRNLHSQVPLFFTSKPGFLVGPRSSLRCSLSVEKPRETQKQRLWAVHPIKS